MPSPGVRGRQHLLLIVGLVASLRVIGVLAKRVPPPPCVPRRVREGGGMRLESAGHHLRGGYVMGRRRLMAGIAQRR